MNKGDLVRLSYNPYYVGIVLRMFKDNFTDICFAEIFWHTGLVTEVKIRELEVLT